MHGLTMTELCDVVQLRVGEGVDVQMADGQRLCIDWVTETHFVMDRRRDDFIICVPAAVADDVLHRHGGIAHITDLSYGD